MKKDIYCSITIAALTGQISAEGLHLPPKYIRHSVTTYRPLEEKLEYLAQGGYVFDLRPLEDHPQIVNWAIQSPMPNGCIEGEEIEHLSESAIIGAGNMVNCLEGIYQKLALMIAENIGVSKDAAGPFDTVSAAYLARYWGIRGARIGKRAGNILCWSDGEQQIITKKVA